MDHKVSAIIVMAIGVWFFVLGCLFSYAQSSNPILMFISFGLISCPGFILIIAGYHIKVNSSIKGVRVVKFTDQPIKIGKLKVREVKDE